MWWAQMTHLRDALLACAALAAWVLLFLIMCASSRMHLRSTSEGDHPSQPIPAE